MISRMYASRRYAVQDSVGDCPILGPKDGKLHTGLRFMRQKRVSTSRPFFIQFDACLASETCRQKYEDGIFC